MPLAAGQHDQRPQQAIGAVALQPDVTDRTLNVRKFEEFAPGLLEIVDRQPRCFERGCKNAVEPRRLG